MRGWDAKSDALTPSRLASAANGKLSLPRSAVLKRHALISSLISRASGFAVANGSVPSMRIVISRQARLARGGA